MRRFFEVEERGLAGLEARAADGSVLGRIVDVLADEKSGEVTHVVIEPEEGEQFEVPITDVVLDPEEAVDPEREAGGWEDESPTAPDSGYPRNDVYIDPDTGEEEVDPRLKDNDTLADDVEDLLVDTGLAVRATRDSVVELTGSAARREDLDALVDEISGLDGVLEVDTTDVDIG